MGALTTSPALPALATVIAGGVLAIAGYLVALALAALFGRAALPPAGQAGRRFAILIPAHNEEVLIGRLLESVRKLDYPAGGFDVHVVADNCDDETAPVARSLGARAYERSDDTVGGKGAALGWLLQKLAGQDCDYDAFVVLDADSVVAPNFLRRMDARLEAGSEAIQAYYSVLNADASPVAALRFVALAALHYLRPLGRSALGLSCGLKGNGMCFSAPIIERFGWRWYTLAEDVELHLALVREGVRVDFAPETRVLADMPVTLAEAAGQNARWERGRLDLLRERVPGLLADGLRRRSPLRLDAAVEQLIPPLSVPFALGGLCLLVGLALRARAATLLAALGLAGQLAHVLVALRLVRAPLSAYVALAYAPVYVAWKVGLYARVLLSGRSSEWARPRRSPR